MLEIGMDWDGIIDMWIWKWD